MAMTQQERKANQRKRDAAREAAREAKIRTASQAEFWAMMRERDAKLYDFVTLQELHERVLDILWWMDHFEEQDENDENFVGLEEGEKSLDDFVREHECPRLGYIYRNQDIPGDGWHEFWKRPDVLAMLCAENGATKGYALYGILSGVPDNLYLEWKGAHGKQPRVDIGRYCDRSVIRYR